MSLHALVHHERFKSTWVIEESSRTSKGSCSHDHASLAHNKTLVAPVHDDVRANDLHPLVGPDVAAPGNFLGGPEDISLLPLYAHYASKHLWERER